MCGMPAWRRAGLRYHRLSHELQARFGGPVRKISVDAQCGCPNADGTLGSGGCIFCNIRSFSPSRRRPPAPIRQQLEQGIAHLNARHRVERFIAYFQPATNTFAPVEQLRQWWTEALSVPGVVGLAVGTRPDCVPDEVLDLLAELAQRTWVIVEYGLQSIHDRSLDWMHRGHDYAAFLDAVQRTQRRGLDIGAHLILGLPGETREDMLATARELARLRLHAVKLHNLYAVEQTPLAALVRSGEVVLPEREAYVQWVVDVLEQLPPECVIDRLSGDAPPEFLVGPAWCLDKAGVQRAIERELERRQSWQGRAFVS